MEDDGSYRTTFLVNFWTKHRPLPPACIEPQTKLLYVLKEMIADPLTRMIWPDTVAQQSNYSTISEWKDVSPVNLKPEELEIKHRLDLQIGLPDHFRLEVTLPKGQKPPGLYVISWSQDTTIEPLLELVMTLHNNAATLGLSLASVRSVIDHYTIQDQGSVDGSPG